MSQMTRPEHPYPQGYRVRPQSDTMSDGYSSRPGEPRRDKPVLVYRP